MTVNVAHLRAFHAVALEGGFTTAARALGVTQPTISTQVKTLEARYSVRLLDRGARGVALTPLGERLFELTGRYFSLEERVEELLGGSKALTGGYLRVGGDGPQHVIPALAAFAQRYPAVEVTLQMGNADAVMRMLSESRLDVGILARAAEGERYHCEALERTPLVALVARTHRWAARCSVELDALAGERLVLREVGSQTRRVFEDGLAGRGLRPARTLEVAGREAVRAAVAAGLGAGVVARAELEPDARIRMLGIRGDPLHLTEYLVCLRERRRLGAVSAFMSLVRERAAAGC